MPTIYYQYGLDGLLETRQTDDPDEAERIAAELRRNGYHVHVDPKG